MFRSPSDNTLARCLAVVSMIVCFVILLSLAGCSARARHVVVVADVSLYEILSDVHATEQIALCGQPTCANVPPGTPPTVPGWTLEKSQAFNKQLVPVVEAGEKFNEILINWDYDHPNTLQILSLVGQISRAAFQVVNDMPDSPAKQRLLTQLNRATVSAVNTLSQLLAQRR